MSTPLSFKADISDIRKTLAELPGITEKEAKEMVNRLESQWKKANTIARKSLKDQEKDAGAAFDSVSRLGEKSASILGGVFGDLGDVVFDLRERFSGVSGSLSGVGASAVMVGGAVTVGAAAVGMLTKAAFDFVGQADEWQDRLRELNATDTVTPEQQQALNQFQGAMTDLEIVSLNLKLALASELAPTLTDIAYGFIGLVEGLRDVQDAGQPVADFFRSVNSWTQYISPVEWGIYAVGVAWDSISQDGQEAAESFTTSVDELGASILAYATEQDRLDIKAELEANRKALEAQRKAQEAVRKAAAKAAEEMANAEETRKRLLGENEAILNDRLQKVKEQEAADKAVADTLHQLHLSQLSGENAINATYDDRIAKLQELASTATDTAAVEEAIRMTNLEREQEIAELREEEHQKQLEKLGEWGDAAFSMFGSVADGLSDMYGMLTEKANEAASNEAAQTDKLKDQRKKLIADIAAAEDKATKQRLRDDLAELDSKLANQKREEQAAKAHALKLWRNEKAVQLATIPVKAAAGVMQAIAQFGPPPSPAGIAAIAAVGISSATQVAQIASSKPPKFHTGGLVRGRGDEVPIMARTNEAVLSERAVNQLGPRTIQSLNSGLMPQEMEAAVYLDGQVIGKAMTWVKGKNHRLGMRNIYGR